MIEITILLVVFSILILLVYTIFFKGKNETKSQVPDIVDLLPEKLVENNNDNNDNNNNNNEDGRTYFNELLNIKNNDNRESEVFNLSENKYTYNDAKLACKSFGAELATITQLNKALKKGANWCNYGWSAQQMALYPIQKEYWDRIQDDPRKRRSCGFPGINGGYFKNENLLFGANCYGPKPDPKDSEGALDYETSNENMNNQKKMHEYKYNVPRVAAFSDKKWSMAE